MTAVVAGNPISVELSDSVTSQVTRLEMENSEMRQELDDARMRLADTHCQLEQVKGQLERDYQKKVAQLEMETKELRQQASCDMSREFKIKVTEIEDKSMKLKKRVSEEYMPKITKLEKANQDLQKQLKSAQANWEKEQERYMRLEARNRVAAEDRQHLKDAMKTMQESSEARIEELERQLRDVQEKTTSVRRSSSRISYVSSDEVNDMSEQMQTVNGAERQHKWKGGDLSMNSYHGQSHNGGVIPQHTDLLRKKAGRRKEQESPAPADRPHSALGVRTSVSGSKSQPVTPQKRSDSTSLSLNPFKRKDKVRSSLSHHNRPAQMAAPFMRNDPLRASLPERKAGYVTPDRRQSRPASPGSISVDHIKAYATPTGFSKHPARQPSGTDHNKNVVGEKSRGYSSDSGCATSPDSPGSDAEGLRDENGHLITSWQVFSSETIRTQVKSSSVPKTDGKWKLLVDKIVELQDKNQALISQNTELRRDMNSVKFTAERLEHLERKNIQLETENKKLKQIIETLQHSLYGPGGLYDNREYQFSSNV